MKSWMKLKSMKQPACTNHHQDDDFWTIQHRIKTALIAGSLGGMMTEKDGSAMYKHLTPNVEEELGAQQQCEEEEGILIDEVCIM